MNDTEFVLQQVERVKKFNEEIARRNPEGEAGRRKVLAQPFITNDLLQNVIKSQTPKWVNYLMLILVALTFGISI